GGRTRDERWPAREQAPHAPERRFELGLERCVDLRDPGLAQHVGVASSRELLTEVVGRVHRAPLALVPTRRAEEPLSSSSDGARANTGDSPRRRPGTRLVWKNLAVL